MARAGRVWRRVLSGTQELARLKNSHKADSHVDQEKSPPGAEAGPERPLIRP